MLFLDRDHVYDLGVHIWPTHYRLAAGHRLALRVSSDDYPEIDSDAPRRQGRHQGRCRGLDVAPHGAAGCGVSARMAASAGYAVPVAEYREGCSL